MQIRADAVCKTSRDVYSKSTSPQTRASQSVRRHPYPHNDRWVGSSYAKFLNCLTSFLFFLLLAFAPVCELCCASLRPARAGLLEGGESCREAVDDRFPRDLLSARVFPISIPLQRPLLACCVRQGAFDTVQLLFSSSCAVRSS